jgi:Ser/Thr protein kinase RdoA (MazF antagonist)
MRALLVRHVGAPLALDCLKRKPGRRRTYRASGPRGRVIVKFYAKPRAGVVAARLSSIAEGPAEPLIPRVLAVAPNERLVVLSEVPGRTLGASLLAGDPDAAVRAGRALGGWHGAWKAMRPPALRPHTVEREREILEAHLPGLAPGPARRIRVAAAAVRVRWEPDTVVHRDLYEEQILVGDRIGLIDLDDLALGPPELDLGNLLAHLDLLEIRSGVPLGRQQAELLAGYGASGPELDPGRLAACHDLALLRLAAIHGCERLLARLSSGAARPILVAARPILGAAQPRAPGLTMVPVAPATVPGSGPPGGAPIS